MNVIHWVIHLSTRVDTLPHVTTIKSPRGEVDSNEVDNTAARVAIPKNKAVISVNANYGDVTNWYQVACEVGVAVT